MHLRTAGGQSADRARGAATGGVAAIVVLRACPSVTWPPRTPASCSPLTRLLPSRPGPAHASLYETCAGLIVAVMVVLYFDERVRRGMTARVRGQAVGWLGAIIGTGLVIPLLALGSFMPDTARIREITVGQTLVFLVAAFGAAIQSWGREDAARIRAAQAPPPVTVPPVPVPPPRAGQTEREHAAEVLGTALAILSQSHPSLVTMGVAKTGTIPEAARLPKVRIRGRTIQPRLRA